MTMGETRHWPLDFLNGLREYGEYAHLQSPSEILLGHNPLRALFDAMLVIALAIFAWREMRQGWQQRDALVYLSLIITQVVTPRTATTNQNVMLIPASANQIIFYASALIALGLLGVVMWRASSSVLVSSVAVAASFWLASYTLLYDFPPLTITLFAALQSLSRCAIWLRVVGLALLVGLLSVPLWEQPISDCFWILIGVSALLAVAYWPLAANRRHQYA